MSQTKLLDAVNSDTDGTAIRHLGGGFTLEVKGTDFGGGTVNIQGSTDGVTFITIAITPDNSTFATYTANAIVVGKLSQAYFIRATLTGSTSPVAVTVTYSSN